LKHTKATILQRHQSQARHNKVSEDDFPGPCKLLWSPSLSISHKLFPINQFSALRMGRENAGAIELTICACSHSVRVGRFLRPNATLSHELRDGVGIEIAAAKCKTHTFSVSFSL
jgi:hypothetical protein